MMCILLGYRDITPIRYYNFTWNQAFLASTYCPLRFWFSLWKLLFYKLHANHRCAWKTLYIVFRRDIRRSVTSLALSSSIPSGVHQSWSRFMFGASHNSFRRARTEVARRPSRPRAHESFPKIDRIARETGTPMLGASSSCAAELPPQEEDSPVNRANLEICGSESALCEKTDSPL